MNRNLRTYAYGRFKEKCTARVDLDTVSWCSKEAELLGVSFSSFVGFLLQAARQRPAERREEVLNLIEEAERLYCERFGIVPTTLRRGA
ncbi:MAG: hypothetical protein K8T91_12980 [Planctomycetes bacterium]|nr:hypothetical protein [Planctomycetota bacterium]